MEKDPSKFVEKIWECDDDTARSMIQELILTVNNQSDLCEYATQLWYNGFFDYAKPCFERVLALGHDSRASIQYADLLCKTGNYSAAFDFFGKIDPIKFNDLKMNDLCYYVFTLLQSGNCYLAELLFNPIKEDSRDTFYQSDFLVKFEIQYEATHSFDPAYIVNSSEGFGLTRNILYATRFGYLEALNIKAWRMGEFGPGINNVEVIRIQNDSFSNAHRMADGGYEFSLSELLRIGNPPDKDGITVAHRMAKKHFLFPESWFDKLENAPELREYQTKWIDELPSL